MGTKRKAEDEILAIPSDDDDGSDSDVQIQEKPIPIVTVDDDDDSSTTAPSHSTPVRQPSPACGGKALDSSLGTPPPPPDISSNRSMSEEKQTMTEEKMASDNLSMKFRDQELFHMFKGSPSECLRTTFQLKMGFNVDSGEAYIDNSKFYGVPPRMGHQSRDEMIRNLEGTLVQGYRRKKLRLDSVAQVDIDRDPADMDLDNPDESFIKVDSVGDCDKLEGLVTASQCSSLPSYNGNIVGAPAMDADEPEEGEVDETEEPQNGSNQNEDEAEDGKNESTNDDSLILVEEEAEVICLDVSSDDMFSDISSYVVFVFAV
ncbi:uncharacterized protein LOC134214689 isoform X1 [Armigeres subalbatus]|uniref:uncharacterized protein LOC134214689 isoform X1 n=1 Tax=Armigeres subalbatus TaxID=124917 RepID=UPI002ED2C447